MYFWRIEKLKNSLAKGPLSQNNGFKYLIYFSVIYTISRIAASQNYDQDLSRWITIPTFLISILLEVYASYRLNGGRFGNDFLGRYLSIRLITTIRLCIFYFLINILVIITLSLTFQTSENPLNVLIEANPVSILELVTFCFYRILVPLRIVFHMRDVAQKERAESN